MRRRKLSGKYRDLLLGAAGILFVFVCYQNMAVSGNAPAISQIGAYIKEEAVQGAWKNCMPVMLVEQEETEEKVYLKEYVMEKLSGIFPVCGYTETITDYDTLIESDLTCNVDTALLESENAQAAENQESQEEITLPAAMENQTPAAAEGQSPALPSQPAAQTSIGKVAEIPREKLNDFDFLIQNFYQVDRTTTIDGSQLNADDLLGRSMKLTGGNENPQILIYHTHSQEGYIDSTPGDDNTSVIAVGEYLASILRNNYGFNVIHHTGKYDVEDRDNAYSYAEPALEQILTENPSIEVVIDLHRDAVADTTHLVSEVNGKQTAKIMFFNGLSRTTANGDIAYLANPNLPDNLAFSFQMKLAAEEYYPGFTRRNYLKGYRYNLHFRPKSLLVEVGAQNNTLQEAMNAMEPLADILHKVLTE